MKHSKRFFLFLAVLIGAIPLIAAACGGSDGRKYEERYDFVGNFYEGLAFVHEDGEWFHITRDENPAYEQRYDWVDSFSEGLARVWKDGVGFRITRDGNRVDE